VYCDNKQYGGGNVKDFIIFLGSFIVLFALFQMVSGLFLTFIYQPDVEEAWNMSANLTSETTLVGSTTTPTIIIAALAAVFAYFVPKAFRKIKRS